MQLFRENCSLKLVTNDKLKKVMVITLPIVRLLYVKEGENCGVDW